MRIAIVGSRNYSNPNDVREFVRSLEPNTIVISGGAPGVDTVAIDEAKLIGLRTEVYPADWRTLGKSAGFIRNRQLVELCDRLVAFWDGESRGTKHSISLASKYNKLERVVRPDSWFQGCLF